MATGRLATAVLTANTPTLVHVVPECRYAELSINILNPESTEAVVFVALSTSSVIQPGDYIEKGVMLPSSGGVLAIQNTVCSPGEHVIIQSTLSNVIVRISGVEHV